MQRAIRLIAALAVAAPLALAVAPAGAKHGNAGRVIHTGDCTGPATWKLQAKPDNGGLEVEFEVDRNRAGLSYSVVLRRNGDAFSRTTRTTAGRSGSFSLSRHTGNRAGTDRITAVATRSGESCRASLSI
jgi:hypothetical protein